MGRADVVAAQTIGAIVAPARSAVGVERDVTVRALANADAAAGA